MTEEIKEMLWKIKRQNTYDDIGYFKTPLSNDDADKLLNYITNLQKENEKLHNQLDFISEQNKYIDKIEKMIKDYKQRNEKAVEYIKNNKDKEIATYGDDYDYETCLFKEDIDDLLNILQGGDE